MPDTLRLTCQSCGGDEFQLMELLQGRKLPSVVLVCISCRSQVIAKRATMKDVFAALPKRCTLGCMGPWHDPRCALAGTTRY